MASTRSRSSSVIGRRVGEVEAQSVGSHQGAPLHHVLAQHLAQRRVEEVGGRVVALGVVTHAARPPRPAPSRGASASWGTSPSSAPKTPSAPRPSAPRPPPHASRRPPPRPGRRPGRRSRRRRDCPAASAPGVASSVAQASTSVSTPRALVAHEGLGLVGDRSSTPPGAPRASNHARGRPGPRGSGPAVPPGPRRSRPCRPVAPLLGHELREVQGKAEGVVESERLLPGDHATRPLGGGHSSKRSMPPSMVERKRSSSRPGGAQQMLPALPPAPGRRRPCVSPPRPPPPPVLAPAAPAATRGAPPGAGSGAARSPVPRWRGRRRRPGGTPPPGRGPPARGSSPLSSRAGS